MAQTTHIPKFGDWDSENIPYTKYFENARKDKGAGLKIFNPNDPEENPDAFMALAISQGNESGKQHDSDDTGDHGTSSVVHTTPNTAKLPHKKHSNMEDGGFQAHIEDPEPHSQTSKSPKSRKLESGSEKSSSDQSLLRSKHHRKGSKHSSGSSHGYMQPPQSQPILQPEIVRANDVHHRAASIPKFGAWDETDPKLAEGYTIIFSKVQEEKKMAATKLPPLPTRPTAYQGQQEKNGNPSSGSKILCCFFPCCQ